MDDGKEGTGEVLSDGAGTYTSKQNEVWPGRKPGQQPGTGPVPSAYKWHLVGHCARTRLDFLLGCFEISISNMPCATRLQPMRAVIVQMKHNLRRLKIVKRTISERRPLRLLFRTVYATVSYSTNFKQASSYISISNMGGFAFVVDCISVFMMCVAFFINNCETIGGPEFFRKRGALPMLASIAECVHTINWSGDRSAG